jgi:hypothetical protein
MRSTGRPGEFEALLELGLEQPQKDAAVDQAVVISKRSAKFAAREVFASRLKRGVNARGFA